MKALFYHPPIENNPLTTMPLAYLYLATSLKQTGHQLELIDARVVKNSIDVLHHKLEGKDVMLVTAMPGSQISSALSACKAVKEVYPKLRIIWGGSHVSLDPKRSIASEYVDMVILGRGDGIIKHIFDCLWDFEKMKEIPNLLYKDENGEVIETKRENGMHKKLNPPDFDLLDSIEPYVCQTRRSKRMIDYLSSFGCPHKCTFCCEPIISGSKWNAIHANELVEHILDLKNKYGIDGVLFQDANFVADRRRLRDFCNLLIEKNVKVNWISTARTSDIEEFHNKGTLKLMQESGCEMLFMGAEAAAEDTIQKYQKGIQPFDTLGIAELLWKEYHIFPHFSYVISFPIEDMDAVRKTLDLRLSVSKIVSAPTGELGFYNPTPGTLFLEENKEFFDVPDTLEGWSRFDFLKQNLYKNPSKELNGVVLKHHITLQRLFPNVKSFMIFDIWQGGVQGETG
ncbi:MAG: B12-binding domain-containing radical SAM protein [Clostridia bacterium]|nr:B12-binding domain-containing radical SAM protein [Clostridia bacterium]